MCGSASYVVSAMNADFFISLIGDSEVGSIRGGGDYVYIYINIFVWCLYIYKYKYLSICLSIYLSIYLSI